VPVPKPKAATGKSAGFDFGLKSFLTCNDGTRIENPQFLKSALRNLRKAHRAVSRKKLKKQLKAPGRSWPLARQYRRVRQLRGNWQWEIWRTGSSPATTKLVSSRRSAWMG
jgi:putative transposase